MLTISLEPVAVSYTHLSPHTSAAVYAGLKAGLNRAIESFAIDLGPYGIRVNGFSPGVIDVRTPEDQDSRDSIWYRDHWRYIPLRRVGRPVDMGNVVSLLVSDKASYKMCIRDSNNTAMR